MIKVLVKNVYWVIKTLYLRTTENTWKAETL